MMRSSSGKVLKYTLFGSSHAEEIGVEISGIKSGFTIDFEDINYHLEIRQGKQIFNTARQESIDYEIVSGIENNITTGDIIKVVFKNKNYNSSDYDNLKYQPRPGHADYVSKMKYGIDNVGGGHFSGRMTAPIVFFGRVCFQIIKSIYPTFNVVSRIKTFQNLSNNSYYDIRKELVLNIEEVNKTSAIKLRKDVQNSLLKDESFSKLVNDKALDLVEEKTSAGGEIESVVINPPSFIGEPFFNGIESEMAKLIYSIPSVKGVSFGYGNDFVKSLGHEVKDEIIYFDDNSLYTLYNYNGGLNGGITNGEDIVVNTVIKPIASIMQIMNTYDERKLSVNELKINGRHDATIINRVIPVIDSMICICLLESLYERGSYEN